LNLCESGTLPFAKPIGSYEGGRLSSSSQEQDNTPSGLPYLYYALVKLL